MSSTDIAVLGAGPAAWALAGRLCARGFAVSVVAPNADAPWPQRFGVWADEATVPVERAFDSVRVDLGAGPFAVDRRYVIVDRAALREQLVAAAAGAEVVRSAAVSVRHGSEGSTVQTTDGRELHARVVVDCTGSGTPFVARSGPATTFQTALGWVARTDAPIPATWMDFSHSFGADAPATFLYAFPRGPGEVFVEETSLVRRGGATWAELESRLRERLAARGVVVTGVLEVERCTIATDLPLPDLDQPLLAFGAAASMVHPATGFQLARSLRLADPVADALRSAWSRGPRAAVRDAWRAVWPADAVRRHHLYTFGGRAVAGLGEDETRAFLSRFFSLGPTVWADWLGDRMTTPELAWAMTRFFVGLRPGLAWRVPVAGLGHFGATT
jgi:lycopene beta-cyclase